MYGAWESGFRFTALTKHMGKRFEDYDRKKGWKERTMERLIKLTRAEAEKAMEVTDDA